MAIVGRAVIGTSTLLDLSLSLWFALASPAIAQVASNEVSADAGAFPQMQPSERKAHPARLVLVLAAISKTREQARRVHPEKTTQTRGVQFGIDT